MRWPNPKATLTNAAPATAEPWTQWFERLDGLTGLDEGWNGDDSPPPDSVAVSNASVFLTSLRDADCDIAKVRQRPSERRPDVTNMWSVPRKIMFVEHRLDEFVVFEKRGADLHGRCPFHEELSSRISQNFRGGQIGIPGRTIK